MRRVLTLLLSLCASAAWAQDPAKLPLVQKDDIRYRGSFAVTTYDGAESLTYGGPGMGVSADGQFLLFGCHVHRNRIAKIRIPILNGTAAVVERCRDVTNLGQVDPGSSTGYVLGGALNWNGRWIVTGYSYYDADGNANSSHFAMNDTLTGQSGPFRLSNGRPGTVGGYMTPIPTEWRGVLGGPALTGLCCTSIISRSSYGPAVGVFNPDDVGKVNPVPATMLVEYPNATTTPWSPGVDPCGRTGPEWNCSTAIGGVAFPRGTRSVLFVGRHGIGRWCYGGTECNDPTSPYQGGHAYPYVHQVWAYDANDLARVKAGTLQRNAVKPYAIWQLPGMDSNGAASIRSATYDPERRMLYVTTDYGENPRVHVYEIVAGGTTPSTDCKPGTWQLTSWDDWSACSAQGIQTRNEVWNRVGDVPPTGGGLACPQSTEGRTGAQMCTPPVKAVTFLGTIIEIIPRKGGFGGPSTVYDIHVTTPVGSYVLPLGGITLPGLPGPLLKGWGFDVTITPRQ